MNRLAFARSAVVALGLIAGTPTFGGTTRPADGGKRPVANPIYSMCAKCRAGSTAAYTVAAVYPNGKQTVAVAFTLESVTPDAATLKTAFTMAGQPGGPSTSKISVPAKMSADLAWPASSGNEDIATAGKTFHCRVYAMRGPLPFASYRSDRPAPMADNKLWVSDDVPGGLVKMQSDRDVADEIGNAHVEMALTACEAK